MIARWVAEERRAQSIWSFRLRGPVLAALLLLSSWLPADAQVRSMRQDPALDNLRHTPGTATTPAGALGGIRTGGSGPRQVLLIPGLGFGDSIWSEFMERHREAWTMHAVTLPGFGGTPPFADPPDSLPFAATPWMRGSVAALVNYLDAKRLQKVTVIAHWIGGSQLALQLALDHPERVEAVVLVGGVLKSTFASVPGMTRWTAAQRAAQTEQLGRQWFRTVTRSTWDDNNFMPWDYARNPLRGLFLWRHAQSPPLSVWVRYLLEFYAVDLEPRLAALRVPILLARPGFDDPEFSPEPGRDYMRDFTRGSWSEVEGKLGLLRVVTIPGSRLFIMHDQPAALDSAIAAFLGTVP